MCVCASCKLTLRPPCRSLLPEPSHLYDNNIAHKCQWCCQKHCVCTLYVLQNYKNQKKIENDDNDVTGEASNVSVGLQTCLLIFCSHHSGDLSALVVSCTQSSSCIIVINFWLRFLSCGRDVLWPGILSSSVQVSFLSGRYRLSMHTHQHLHDNRLTHIMLYSVCAYTTKWRNALCLNHR